MTLKDLNVQTLCSFCQNDSSLKTKIALLTIYKIKYPGWTEILILLIEYLQLISQAILSASLVLEERNHNPFILRIVVYFFKLITPSYLLSYENSDSIITTVLIVVIFCTLFKFLLFANVIYGSIRDQEMNSWLLYLWRWIYKLQTRVLYYLFTSFWVKAMIETRERGFVIFGVSQSYVHLLGSMVLGTELLLSLILETQFCYFLPTGNFLSSKNNQLQLAAFVQKVIIQVFTLLISSGSQALVWVISIIGFIMGLIKYVEFFYTLPLHHLKALLLQGSLLGTALALHFAYTVNEILKASHYQGAGLEFVIFTWILLALLTNKISYEAVKFQIFSLLCTANHGKKSPEVLLHRVMATKELLKSAKVPALSSTDYTLNYVVLMNHSANFEGIFGLAGLREQLPVLGLHELPTDLMNKIYLLYDQELCKKYPKNKLVKLHTAYRSLKNSEPYSQTIKIITGI